MSNLNRRRFLTGAGVAAGGLALGSGAQGQVSRVPMQVEPTQGWLSWINATTSCLQALGCVCDAIDVAGATGYAFVLHIPETVGVWGPTAFQWDILHEGIPWLGRATMAYYAPQQNADTYRDAFEFVTREVGAGRPCVINGAFVPEFAAVVAVDEAQYHFVGAVREGPLAHDALDAPGGVYALAFPTALTVEPGKGDRQTINHGVQLMRQDRHPFS
ncbi:MAG TPA: twin-arginine translocation signal domain-containing protein, partial [Armatimonadota bacterium]|nr:twin-arginine translocation signal domain-containing protein [Armatimonadota bacterium]